MKYRKGKRLDCLTLMNFFRFSNSEFCDRSPTASILNVHELALNNSPCPFFLHVDVGRLVFRSSVAAQTCCSFQPRAVLEQLCLIHS